MNILVRTNIVLVVIIWSTRSHTMTPTSKPYIVHIELRCRLLLFLRNVLIHSHAHALHVHLLKAFGGSMVTRATRCLHALTLPSLAEHVALAHGRGSASGCSTWATEKTSGLGLVSSLRCFLRHILAMIRSEAQSIQATRVLLHHLWCRSLINVRVAAGRRGHVLWLSRVLLQALLISPFGLHCLRQAKSFDYDLALDVGAGHVEVLPDVEPDWLDFLRGQLDQVLETHHVVRIFQRERLCHISKLDILDVSVLLWEDEHVPVRVLHLVVILHKVFADDGHFACSGIR